MLVLTVYFCLNCSFKVKRVFSCRVDPFHGPSHEPRGRRSLRCWLGIRFCLMHQQEKITRPKERHCQFFFCFFFYKANPAYTLNYTPHHTWLYFDTLSFNHRITVSVAMVVIAAHVFIELIACISSSPASEHVLFIFVNLLLCLQSRYLLSIDVQFSLTSFSLLLARALSSEC